MAIWQVPIFLVKEENILKCSEKHFFESLDGIKRILPEEKSWSESIRQFGNIGSTCLEIFYNDLGEDEIKLRLDLRNITKAHLQEIIRFANENELKLNYENELYEATMTNFKVIIKNSVAYKFVSNPKEFFDPQRCGWPSWRPGSVPFHAAIQWPCPYLRRSRPGPFCSPSCRRWYVRAAL